MTVLCYADVGDLVNVTCDEIVVFDKYTMSPNVWVLGTVKQGTVGVVIDKTVPITSVPSHVELNVVFSELVGWVNALYLESL